jgi:hypothetical protein
MVVRILLTAILALSSLGQQASSAEQTATHAASNAATSPVRNQHPAPSPSAPPTSKASEAPTATSPLSDSERDELRKARLVRDVQEQIKSWLGWQFWLGVGAFALITLFGVKAYAQQMIATELRGAVRATAEAEAAAAHAKAVTDRVHSAAEDEQRVLTQLRASATEVDRRFTEIKARMDAERDHAVSFAANQAADLSRRLDELNDFVTKLADESRKSQEIVSAHEARLATLKSEALASTADFERNAKHTVVVTHHGGPPTAVFANALLEQLKKQGFRAVDGSWAGSVPRRFDSVRIHHGSGLRDAALRISDTIVQIADRTKTSLLLPVELFEQDMTPLGGYDVVVFLGA